jgi:hypothetical protein
MSNSAHIYKSKSGNWNVSFHHPICREGSIGKKVHRSLKVSDEDAAKALRDEMNTLLALADTPAHLPTRTQAIAEGRYARVVIDAFFDCMTPEPTDYFALRDNEIPLPPRVPGQRNVPRMLLVGSTGAGKSRFGQHFLGTTRQNYPMRGAGRTTVADTETIVEDTDFTGIITFYSENEIREVIKDNIVEACAFSDRGEEDEAKIAMKLLVDSDKRFRFNYTLGTWTNNAEPDEEDEEDRELIDHEDDVDAQDNSAAQTKLASYVAQIIAMTKLAHETARRELQPDKPEDEAVIQEYWQLYIERDQIDSLAEQILEEMEKKLCAATGTTSWPVIYRIPGTKDKAEFFRRLRTFYQNDRKLFGTLVTPLVQGIRVRGRFGPEGAKIEPLVLLDGQGVGHEQGGSKKINRTIPPELAKKFSDADLICLVDRAVPAMTGDAPILLQHLVVRGHQQRLALLFTHFEAVAAPDLDVAGRKTKVLEGISNTIQDIESLPKTERVILEGTIEAKAYFLSRLNEHELKKATQTEITKIRAQVQRSVGEPVISQCQPMFNEYSIAKILDSEIARYRQNWSESELSSSYHWKTMEALTNWIGHAYADGFPRRNLYPAQNLSERLVGAVSVALEEPIHWEPHPPENADEQSQLLNTIRRQVAQKIDAYCREILVRDPRTGHWLPAYENISGRGTKVRRARAVARILEDRAELPNEGVGKFTKDIWHIVQETITQVCQQPAVIPPHEVVASS